MVVEVLFVLLGNFGVHPVELVLHALALDDAVGGLVDLALEVGNVLHCYVGVGVCLAGCSGIVGCLAILVHVVDALLDEACLGMLLAVEDVGLGLLVVAVLHQSELYAVLDFLDGETVAYGNTLAEVCCYGVDFLLVPTGYRLKCPYDGILDFLSFELLFGAISLYDYH